MREIIGYESGASNDHPMIWGAAALRTEEGIFNAVTGFGPMSQEDWDKLVARGTVTQLEVPVPVKSKAQMFVIDLRLDLLDKDPYKLDGDSEWQEIEPGVVGVGRGQSRGYYIFENHKRVESWLYHLHAGKYYLVSAI